MFSAAYWTPVPYRQMMRHKLGLDLLSKILKTVVLVRASLYQDLKLSDMKITVNATCSFQSNAAW